MTFDPAAAVLGADTGAALGGDLGPGGDLGAGVGHRDGASAARPEDAGEHLRAVARRQWTARRDLERRLHDGAALRLSALALQLGLLRHRHPGGPDRDGADRDVAGRDGADRDGPDRDVAGRDGPDRGPVDLAAAVEELQDGLHLVLQELRDVAGMLYPPLLDEAGLGPALREAVGRCPVPVRIHAPRERFGAEVEGVAYFALLGCLPAAPVPPPGAGAPVAAAGPDAGAEIDIVIRREGEVLVLLVHGVAGCHAGPLDEGVRLLGGTVTVGDPAAPDPVAAGPITVRIPCA